MKVRGRLFPVNYERANFDATAKSPGLTQRRKAAKILKKTFDLLCALASLRLNLMFFQ
jgi:hypothetical protein